MQGATLQAPVDGSMTLQPQQRSCQPDTQPCSCQSDTQPCSCQPDTQPCSCQSDTQPNNAQPELPTSSMTGRPHLCVGTLRASDGQATRIQSRAAAMLVAVLVAILTPLLPVRDRLAGHCVGWLCAACYAGMEW